MRVGIVNDLRLAVETLKRAVALIPGASVAWIAEDGAQAVRKCAEDRPDLILMDMIMPVMDGVEATRRIMAATPCPILVVTATVEGNSSKVFEALGAGALDAVQTPGLAADGGVVNGEPMVRKALTIDMLSGSAKSGAESAVPTISAAVPARSIAPMVALGSSTGGPMALAAILKSLPASFAWPVIVVQHVDPQFAPGLASWLGGESGRAVGIAAPGDRPTPGRVLIASTVDHLIIDRQGSLSYSVEPKAMVYRPSVDVFFESLAAAGASPGVAVVLTGMGRDGAVGMSRLRADGWHTIAQDRASSVVWGMPGACVEAGAAMEVLPFGEIGHAIAARMAFRESR